MHLNYVSIETMCTLENNHLKITIKNAGAELASIVSKDNGIQYLWKGNPHFWGRQSPALFPFVGGLKNNTYFIDDISYELPKHGFARDSLFELIESNNEKKVFELTTSNKTLKMYPYTFKLQICYTLQKNTLTIDFNIINNDKKTMYFSIGAHPAFNCPLINNTNFSDYYIDFEHKENCKQLFVNARTGLIDSSKTTMKTFHSIPLDYSLFDNDALIFESLKSKFVSLRSTKHDNGITVTAENWDYFAFWTKKNAPFLCFEPWMGIADFDTTNQNFKEKTGIKKLPMGENYNKSYSITFF